MVDTASNIRAVQSTLYDIEYASKNSYSTVSMHLQSSPPLRPALSGPAHTAEWPGASGVAFYYLLRRLGKVLLVLFHGGQKYCADAKVEGGGGISWPARL